MWPLPLKVPPGKYLLGDGLTIFLMLVDPVFGVLSEEFCTVCDYPTPPGLFDCDED